MAWTPDDTRSIAEEVMNEFRDSSDTPNSFNEVSEEFVPQSLSHAAAYNVSKEADEYPDLVERGELAGSLDGELGSLAMEIEKSRMMDGDEMAFPDLVESDTDDPKEVSNAVLDALARRALDRRS
jgi:hypothetical protein